MNLTERFVQIISEVECTDSTLGVRVYFIFSVHKSVKNLTKLHGSIFLYLGYMYLYRVIHKSLRDFRTRLRNNQERHGRKEHINR